MEPITLFLLLLGGAILVWRKAFTPPRPTPRNGLPRLTTPPQANAVSAPRIREQPPLNAPSTAAPEIELNDDFKNALSLVGSRRTNLFITGNAGTGKSTLLHLLSQRSGRNSIVVAPTGLAAINVGGQTIHSFFRLPPRLIQPGEIEPRRDPSVLRALDLLIIDEISMVRVDLLDGIDRTLRVNRRSNVPFGGVQVVMFGDLMQLPPVVRESDLQEYFKDTFGGPYFFCSDVWKEAPTQLLELKKNYRQRGDVAFQELLNAVRRGSLSQTDLDALNSRVCDPETLPDADRFVRLTATNDAAYRINIDRLNSLKSQERTYSANVSGKFDPRIFPTEEQLDLRVGARVMFLKNDREKGYVNGSFGTVSRLDENRVLVELDNGRSCEVTPSRWENIEYQYDRSSKQVKREVVGSFDQLPLRLGWAITIHKSQGQTFDRVLVDLGNGAFAHGQTYVALSRCRRLDGLRLARPIRQKDLICDPGADGFRHVFSGSVAPHDD